MTTSTNQTKIADVSEWLVYKEKCFLTAQKIIQWKHYCGNACM